jgi:hypothetical protein
LLWLCLVRPLEPLWQPLYRRPIPERRVLGSARQRLYEAAETAGHKITEAAGERVVGAVKERAWARSKKE